MKNEMTLDQRGLTIPAEELAEHGLDGADLSAQMTRSLILLMPQKMTAEQMVDALAGLCEAASQLVEVLTAVSHAPCIAECDMDDEDFDLDAVPDDVLILLLNCGCCPAQLAHHLAEGDVIYAVE